MEDACERRTHVEEDEAEIVFNTDDRTCVETTPTLLYIDYDNDDMYDIDEEVIPIVQGE